ncbi:hypothetical protein [Pedobacter frigidisoli]|uniref:hypothetical protein n=1 Tax=Pedobacter frigidisoli TaxID=2530455 RepID=UPI00292EC35E|nr:hypothetical protein [Pedobacter frigidisoli]
MKLLLFSISLLLLSITAYSQTGCRRTATGIAYTTQLFDGSYNFSGPSFDASKMCLPVNDNGVPCTIRIPFTVTTYSGVLGNYNILNCNMDHGDLMFLAIAINAICMIKIVKKDRSGNILLYVREIIRKYAQNFVNENLKR